MPAGVGRGGTELAGRAVVFAAEHPHRREYWVGGSTAITLIGNKIAAGLGDRYLAKTGYKSQQSSEPRDPNQPVNLWEPADSEKDFGTHGIFDSRSSSSSVQLWASQHHGTVAALGALALGVVTAITALARKAVK